MCMKQDLIIIFILKVNFIVNPTDTGTVNGVNLPVLFPSVLLWDVISVVSESDIQPLRNYKEEDDFN